jgi:hypothetical protein
MIDENLCRADLEPVEMARQTARRKVIYEELHPLWAPLAAVLAARTTQGNFTERLIDGTVQKAQGSFFHFRLWQHATLVPAGSGCSRAMSAIAQRVVERPSKPNMLRK